MIACLRAEFFERDAGDAEHTDGSAERGFAQPRETLGCGLTKIDFRGRVTSSREGMYPNLRAVAGKILHQDLARGRIRLEQLRMPATRQEWRCHGAVASTYIHHASRSVRLLRLKVGIDEEPYYAEVGQGVEFDVVADDPPGRVLERAAQRSAVGREQRIAVLILLIEPLECGADPGRKQVCVVVHWNRRLREPLQPFANALAVGTVGGQGDRSGDVVCL